MISLNRGEWSELYGILFLLVRPIVDIVDSDLNTIDSTEGLFVIKEIISSSKVSLRYELINDTVLIYIDKEEYNRMSIDEIDKARKLLIDQILNVKSKKGAFTVPTLNDFLVDFSNNNVFKTGSGVKEDIELILFDSKKSSQIELTYSMKSSLGSPATILNASNNTNFKYKIDNLNDSDIEVINSIETRTKLLDRINMIESLGGIIHFDSVPSDTFEYNLKMVDTNMPKYLGNALLYSYQKNNKDLKEIFIEANQFHDENMAIKKLGDLIAAISFGFFPGTKWDGNKTVTGGLIIVKDNGDVCVLDLIYFENEVRKYLVNECKLDSPSSKRYHMLELIKENNETYFTLNLQIRYKK